MSATVTQFVPNARLKQARERAGYATAMQFTRANNLKYTTYAHHENGRRRIEPEVAELYERLLNMPPLSLLFGDQLPKATRVPIVGRVGTMGKVQAISTAIQYPRAVSVPFSTDMVGTEVFGDDLYPMYRNGDVVFHRQLDRGRFNPDAVDGLECIVELENGEQLLRQVEMQHNGLFQLHAHQAPPLVDQRVVAASPIEMVHRRLPRYFPQG